MPTVTITHPDASTEQISETLGWKYRREIGEMWKLTIEVERSAASAVTLNRREDEVELSGVTTGRLVDVNKGGSTWQLVVRSFEWDAKKEEPIQGGDRRTGDDQTLLTNLIGEVSTWTAGSLSNLTGDMTFILNHSFAHEAMRRIEKNVPGELKFNSDKSVDYVQDRGSDKTASVTLSSAQGNLNGEIRIEERGRELDVTHLRVIGASEGQSQVYANLVPSGDSGNYDNEVTYTTSRWSGASDTVWGRWSNKDVTDQAAIDEEAAALGGELTETLVEASATVEGEDLALGDWVRVTKSDADLDRDMRIHRIVTRTVEGSPAATVDEVLLSTRTIARDSESNRLRDIQRYNVAFQGDSVSINAAGGRQPVDAGTNYIDRFYYPAEVEYEHRLNVRIMALAYRSFSESTVGADNFDSTSNGNTDARDESGSSSTTSVGDSSFTTVETVDVESVGGVTAEFGEWVHRPTALNFRASSGSFGVTIRAALYDSGGSFLRNTAAATFQAGGSDTTHTVLVTGNDVAEVRFEAQSSSGTNDLVTSYWVQAAPDHEHLMKPGLDELFSPEYDKQTSSWSAGATRKILPMNPDLLINGSKVAGGADVLAVDPSGSGSAYQGEGTPMEVGRDTSSGGLDTTVVITVAGSYPLQISTVDDNEGSYTTSSQVDLSGHDELYANVRDLTYTGASQAQIDADVPGAFLVIGNNKTDPYDTNVRSVSFDGTVDGNNFEVGTATMDVSDLTGSYYVRFHTVGVSGVDLDTELGHILLDPIYGELGQDDDEYVVDVTGQFNEGAVNTVEVTSSQPGNYQVWIEGDVYRQILGGG